LCSINTASTSVIAPVAINIAVARLRHVASSMPTRRINWRWRSCV